MKKINCITSLPLDKQYEIRRWFWITILIAVIMMITGGCFLIPQIDRYLSLTKEIALLRKKKESYASANQHSNILKKEYDELSLRENKINSYTQQGKNPLSHIAYIVQTCGSTIQIESIRFNKKSFEVEVLCTDSQQAQLLVQNLSASPGFSQVKMISLHQNAQTNQIRCTIKANVIF